METLQEATERICDLKGNLLVIESFVAALIRVLPLEVVHLLRAEFDAKIEAAKVVLLNSPAVGELTLAALEKHALRLSSNLPEAHP